MTSFGIIRWDAWYTNDGPARYTRQSLSNQPFRTRAPLHANLTNKYITYEPTQATMDAEITAAANANVGYFAFLRYLPGNSMNEGYNLYNTSSIRASVPFCWMLFPDYFGSTGNYSIQVADIVNSMQLAHWKKIGGRPLLYIMWNDNYFAANWGSSMSAFKEAVDALRTAAIAAGLSNPFITVLHAFSIPYSPVQQKTGIGADAVSAYISELIPSALAAPYTALDTITRSYWDVLKADAATLVPICMSGWDRRPRIDRPFFSEFATQFPRVGHNSYIIPPTTSEFVAHLEAAKAYIAANPVACPVDTALIYAWNECDEGVGLTPTYDGKGQALLTAAASTMA